MKGDATTKQVSIFARKRVCIPNQGKRQTKNDHAFCLPILWLQERNIVCLRVDFWQQTLDNLDFVKKGVSDPCQF